LSPYLQQQQAAAGYNETLQRAMQAAVGAGANYNQQQTNAAWPSGLYDALTAPYLQQQQQQQQQPQQV
jgi:hypothetical protein